jgi:hypothetical protein
MVTQAFLLVKLTLIKTESLLTQDMQDRKDWFIFLILHKCASVLRVVKKLSMLIYYFTDF